MFSRRSFKFIFPALALAFTLSACEVRFNSPADGRILINATQLVRLKNTLCQEQLLSSAKALGLDEATQKLFAQNLNKTGYRDAKALAEAKGLQSLPVGELFASSSLGRVLQNKQVTAQNFPQVWAQCTAEQLHDSQLLAASLSRLADAPDRMLLTAVSPQVERNFIYANARQALLASIQLQLAAHASLLQQALAELNSSSLAPIYAQYTKNTWRLTKLPQIKSDLPALPAEVNLAEEPSEAQRVFSEAIRNLDAARFHLLELASISLNKQAVAKWNALSPLIEAQLQKAVALLGSDPRSIDYTVKLEGSLEQQLAQIKERILDAQAQFVAYSSQPDLLDVSQTWAALQTL